MASITELVHSGSGDRIGEKDAFASKSFVVVMNAVTEDAIIDHIGVSFPREQEHPRYGGLFVTGWEKVSSPTPLVWFVDVEYEGQAVTPFTLSDWQLSFNVSAETERVIRSIALSGNETQQGISIYDGRVGPELTSTTPPQIVGPVWWREAVTDRAPPLLQDLVLGTAMKLDGSTVDLTAGTGQSADIRAEDLPRRPDGFDRLSGVTAFSISRKIPFDPFPGGRGAQDIGGPTATFGSLMSASGAKTHVNSAEFLGEDKQTVLLANMQATQTTIESNGDIFDAMDVTLEFGVNPDKWTPVEYFDTFTFDAGYEAVVRRAAQFGEEWPPFERPISTWYVKYREANFEDIFTALNVSAPRFA